MTKKRSKEIVNTKYCINWAAYYITFTRIFIYTHTQS